MTGTHDLSSLSDQDKIKEIVEVFIKSTDEQDANKLATTMHDEAMQHVIFGPQLFSFSKKDYLDQVKAKKVGGTPRTIAYEKVVMSGDHMAMVQLIATSSEIKFHYQVILFRRNGNWKIMSICAEAQKI